MKKLYYIICASVFTFLTINANSTTIHVNVGQTNGGTTAANQFNPNNFTASVGDTVVWTWFAGFHNVNSLSVPSGAATFLSPTLSSAGASFSYTITTAGNYGYDCSIHGPNMFGGFIVTGGVGISVLAPNNLFTNAYPNPFTDKLSIYYNGINKIEVMNVLGEQVKSIEMRESQGTLEMNFDGMPSGIYFYRTYKEGIVSETRKIVKSK